ncbi:MAG: carbamoyl-phosphate synthase large subunit [Deltaproteobacteria bacterium]|jgi:acetyl/propionyl-CoA carboxylase alpha subunit/acetyl-CoA carboxylase carboxyltransferase component|nr:carbamoyl-phosphate synthase large subunit [Deltaproteobacteria bacterium]MBT6499757.1 carbamoyl-phosphate synthase large subunit [Deltaproteobacteria bacterium]MBT6613443.1 carbamoyl-phosphate synthase large subunit [Deltaproteobacteria bacterium]MBT7151457.1 carbamoyl-phosphate synthase large subunit [Deltaproteobacteria bacterium]MBT7712712.1 carbamoyl-phosphate synthase large subunit [Deltaproteobacteria bacterium]
MKLLIANRGEIAIRIMRSAAELKIRTVAVYAEDDIQSLHLRRADETIALTGNGVATYLDIDQILNAASQTGCDAIHPGYGFLSENAEFAKRCKKNGITFIGPQVETLEILGDKARARNLADNCNVPLLQGTTEPVSLAEANAFFESLDPDCGIMIKAVSGGGGRGMREVTRLEDLEEAYNRCQSEASQAFGNDAVYVEQLMTQGRHIEIQIIGDGTGAISHLGERECTIQRQHQKLIEFSPSPTLPDALRDKLIADAVHMAASISYLNAGTFEFMVDAQATDGDGKYGFIEANPRLQVEHTVTEEVMDVDLVRIQILLAQGKTLSELGLDQVQIPPPRGYAIQVRINMETMQADGSVLPSGGTLSSFEVPSGRGIRTDSFGYASYQPSPYYDSLLAKLIGHSPSPDFEDAVDKTYRALCEFRIEGIDTNLPLLQDLLSHADFRKNNIDTGFVEAFLGELSDPVPNPHQKLYFETQPLKSSGIGAQIDSVDPLAVLNYGKEAESLKAGSGINLYTGYMVEDEEDDILAQINAPMQGTIVSMDVQPGEEVREGQQLLVMNAMKMEHVVKSRCDGKVQQLRVEAGETVAVNQILLVIEKLALAGVTAGVDETIDLDEIRPDLAELLQRKEFTKDSQRPQAVKKRRKRNQRTARENVADLCDDGSFMEYGSLAVAAQRKRRTEEDLIKNTPADGMLAGIGSVNGHIVDESRTRCAITAYDFTVLAGTQGTINHRKKDRIFELAEQWQIPLVVFAEGGGGRPGDTDSDIIAGLDCMAFHIMGRLSGLVPLIGINSGRCFAGNAVLLGICDVVIATENSNIGMGGPAMIEGGDLGVFQPDEIGPMRDQVPNGVVDIAVKDEAEAVSVAKQYLSYFQGPVSEWECGDQRLLRRMIPENRMRVYDIRSVITTMADTDSVLELRPHFGLGIITSFIRIEGRPLGLIANNPKHLSGAIDSPAADKASRFMQLCDAFDIPILFLCDTPGFMVGPEAEKTALVRHCCRLFVNSGSLSVPYFTIVLRKSYGLGAQGMAGGSQKAPFFTFSWPTGEFGGMGLEGAVKLGFRKELAAVEDPQERKELYEKMVAMAYQHGKAINMASHFEIDEVIDPADSRFVVIRGLQSVPAPEPRKGKKRPCIDTW